jgi:hypothetical protein
VDRARDVSRRRVRVSLREGALLRDYQEFTGLPNNRRLLAYSLQFKKSPVEKTLALADGRATNRLTFTPLASDFE